MDVFMFVCVCMCVVLVGIEFVGGVVVGICVYVFGCVCVSVCPCCRRTHFPCGFVPMLVQAY